jgi:hypothetical protein
MAGKRQPLQPPTPSRPQPLLGQEAPSLGKDVPEGRDLSRAPVIRSGAIIMAAVWEE